MNRFFPADKIVLTGNPVRSDMIDIEGKRKEAFDFYELDSNKKTILIIGGSLGARTLNQSMKTHLAELQKNDIQVLWQCGKFYVDSLTTELLNVNMDGIKMIQFIARMDLAYAMADVIISRAGAISVSELCLIKKPIVLVPSPNVSEDHQTKNAMALVSKGAAVLVKDIDSVETLISTTIEILNNEEQQNKLIEEISKLGKPKATSSIVDEIEKII